jgi:hypothetical protein
MRFSERALRGTLEFTHIVRAHDPNIAPVLALEPAKPLLVRDALASVLLHHLAAT